MKRTKEMVKTAMGVLAILVLVFASFIVVSTVYNYHQMWLEEEE